MKAINRKSFRYFYWIAVAFLKKNAQLILLSFLAGVIGIITIVSISPYFIRVLTTKKHVIGMAGSYTVNNVPDEILGQISNSLVFINEKGEIIPILAESWEQLDDGKEYRFHLKKGLNWEDGKDFTAHDLNYSFTDVQVEVPDDYVIVFKLKEPLPIFPTFLTEPVVRYPLQGVAGLYNVERMKTQYGSLTELHLTPNKENYPIYIYKFYENETKLINAFKMGEITEFSTTKKNIADLFRNWKNATIEESTDYSQLLTLFFNMNNPLLQERDVRKAISMSIPRDVIIEQGEQSFGPIPPTSWAYNTDIKQTQYNPDLSKKLFEKYMDGSSSAELKLSTFFDYLSTADTIRDSLKDIGINANVNVFSPNELDSYDMLLAYWRVPQDPDQYYFWHSTQEQGNISNYKNVKIDKLLEDGRSTIDQSSRKEIYDSFQVVIADDLPAFFLYYPYVYNIVRK
ncbi:MAG: ABC transporter substrate-binding protein [Patescibacteria group bacterium]